MAPIYLYKCKKCGAQAELPYGKEGTRHLVDGEVCGTFRRDWSTVGINIYDLRAHHR